MGKTKPLTYPNLIETMMNVGNAHSDIHTAVAGHAQDHATGIAAKRKALEIKHNAHKLMTGESTL